MIAQRIQSSFERSFGTGCFLAYFALVFFEYAGTMVQGHMYYAIVLSMLLIVALACCAYAADTIDAIGPARLSVGACICCSASPFLFALLPENLNMFAGSALALAGCLVLFLIFGKNLAFYGHEERICQLSAVFIIGAALCAVSSALPHEARLVMLFLLPVLAALHLCTLKQNKDTFSFANLKTTRESYQFSVKTLYTTAMTGLIWGIAFCLIAKPSYQNIPIAPYFSLPLAAGGILLIVDVFKTRRLSESNLLRAFAFVSFVGIAPLLILPSWAHALLGAFLFFAFSFDTIVCFSAMGETARFNQISPYWVFGISLAYYFAGATAGSLIFGWVLAQNSFSLLSGTSLLLLAIIIWSTDFLFQDSYPSEELASTDESQMKSENRPAVWQRKIDLIIERYELTARQQEVFRLLVRGRNASYIAENFFISNSTAKAHIHNIYRKLDIHSQQELINLVENADPGTPPRQDSSPSFSEGPA